MQTYIHTNGITNQKPEKKFLPNIEEVEFCKNILTLIKEKKGFHLKSSSYGYKHVVEKHFKNNYISNGAFIQAAKDLGFSFKRFEQSLNVYFKFSKKDLEKALATYLINQKNKEELPTVEEPILKCIIKKP